MTRLMPFLVALAFVASPGDASPILTITVEEGAPAVEFDRDDLADLPQVSYRTKTEFTDGAPEFSGPLARDVLAAAGVDDADTVVMTAANDYSIEIPMAEIRDYDVIFATSVDGERLSLRDKGPIWVMYPLDRHEELQDPVYNSRLIWQMVRVDLR